MDKQRETKLTKEDLNKQYNQLFDNIVKYKPVWKQIKKYVNPHLGFFEEDMVNSANRDDEELLNQMPTQANTIQAAGMQSGITSPSRPWFKLKLSNSEVSEIDEVKNYVNICEEQQYNVFAQSNFYNNAHSFYEELGAFGSACMLILEDLEGVVNYKTLTIGEYAVGLDSRGRVNKLARFLNLTVGQIVEQFGIDNVPPTIRNQYENKNYNSYYKVKHLIYPNPQYDPNKLGNVHFKYKDVYWMDECIDNQFLKQGGFTSCPVTFARWKVTGSDIYGKSCGWLALSDSKALQIIEADMLTGLEMQIKPPMIAPISALTDGGINMFPGGVSPYSANGSGADNAIRPAYMVNPNFAETANKIAKLEASINKTFFADLFLMLEQIDHAGMTATEIQERQQEKMTMIGPVLERLQNEFLRPLIERTFELMQRVPNLLPPPPQAIQGMQLHIEYVSILAQAQRMTSITAIQQTAGFVMQLAQANPQVLDKIDFDTVIDEYAQALGVPPAMIIGEDKVQMIRQQRAMQQEQQQQAMQQQNMMQQMQQGAGIAKTLGDTSLDNNSALNALLGMPNRGE